MIAFLNALDAAGIGYVSWKNNHELPDALAGNSDLDIFIAEQHRAETLRLAASQGWKQLENPVASYPWVTHLYSLDDNLRHFHLHVYFRLVTGESWLKEYLLPFGDLLVAERVKFADTGVWGLNARAQAYLYLVRHLLKGASFFSRLLYRRELESYRDEWLRCGQRVEGLKQWGPIRLDEFLDASGVTDHDVELPAPRAAKRFRARMAHCLRFPRWSLTPRRIYSLAIRALNKLLLRRKKIICGGGMIVAISGVDGAGKSTMLSEAHRVFSKFITVRRVALGKPQGALLEALRKIVRVGKPRSESPAPPAPGGQQSRSPSMLSSLSAALLALLRLKTARRAQRYAAQGYLVLADRWPTAASGMMDGPKLDPRAGAPWLPGTCARLERWAYRRMPRADVCFFLQAPDSVLVERNRGREKRGKESDAEIISRSEHNRQFEPLAQKTVHFDNNGPLPQKRRELLQQIWRQIAAS